MGANYSQFFPPQPTLTEKNLASQNGKVFIVTGGASGVGLELAKILFQAGGKVYIAGRSEVNARRAIEYIESSSDPSSTSSKLEFLHLELDDLTTIKSTVESFKLQESRLDVLWNNAGISLPPVGSTSKQGYELQVATNCLGHFLLAQLLQPLLKNTAEVSSPNSVRVVWTSSVMVDVSAPIGGLNMKDLSTVTPKTGGQEMYVASKVGNWFIGSEMARRYGKDGIISVTQNPGNLKTNLTRHVPWMKYMAYPLLYNAKMGAYTELWAGLSSEVKGKDNGCYVVPWGRIQSTRRQDLLDALKSVEANGTGRANEFWEWCQAQTDLFR
jgi:NAD(P)-dependent dehydrogenase (short-subunit alcohol dehydrogenase family)